MDTTDDLVYSLEANITASLFYSDLNDVNIFVEDQGKEYIYETIFKRLMRKGYRITKIFGVGGKEQLKSCFNELGTKSNNASTKNVYIADGDFDRYLYAEDMIDHPSFIYLKTYNIENYLIDKEACEKFVKGQLHCQDDEVERKVGFDTWKSNILEQAGKLFFCYCFVKKVKPGEETVGRSPYLFIDQKTGLERAGAFEKYWEHVRSLDPEAETIIEQIKEIYFSQNKDVYNLICGKFLFESLYCHIKRLIKRTFRKDDFYWALVCNFDITSLNYVKERLLSIMEG